MQPPSKKQKIASRWPLEKSPIFFHQPELKPDVLLKVFDIDFHVQPVVLKLRSAFFRQLLGCAECATMVSQLYHPVWDVFRADRSSHDFQPRSEAGAELAPPQFKYIWMTKMDEERNEM